MFTMRRFVLVLFLGVFCFSFIFLSYWSSKQTSQTLYESAADAARRQIARKELMKEYCLTHSYKTKPPPRDLQHIIVDHENKVIYCSIPKVSSTTWKWALIKPRGLKENIKKIHSKRLWPPLNQFTEKGRSERIKTYFKFLFVREPLHRLLSAYKDKFVGRDKRYSEKYRQQIVKAYRPQDYKPNGDYNDINITFAEFIQYYSRDVSRDRHWRQYEKLCHPCVINYDFIGHLETLEEDAQLLLKMAGIDDRVTFPSIHKSTDSDEVLEYYSQVPPRYIRQLGELYRNDFEMFGYDYLGHVQPLLNKTEQRKNFQA